MRIYHLSVILAAVLNLGGCVTPKGVTKQDQRNDVIKMENETLAKLYAAKPETRDMVRKASGYAVFSSIGTHIFVLAGGSGYGSVVNNANKRRTYMKMRSLGVGFGMGVKDFRAIFIFKTRQTLDDFINKGWEFGGQADAAAKSGEKGGAASGEAMVDENIIVYQLTEAGLALQATVGGTKYWRDKDLN